MGDRPSLERDYTKTGSKRENPELLSRRRKILYELEVALDLQGELNCLEKNRPRVTNQDLVCILEAVFEKLDEEPEILILDHDEAAAARGGN